MVKVLQNVVSKQTGRFKGTVVPVLIEFGLINFFVLFLPLEKEHVKLTATGLEPRTT